LTAPEKPGADVWIIAAFGLTMIGTLIAGCALVWGWSGALFATAGCAFLMMQLAIRVSRQ
jgi:hypothetical protein